jgi:hypothetical protein
MAAEHVDAIVVGARCAGSAARDLGTALRDWRERRPVLVDRA